MQMWKNCYGKIYVVSDIDGALRINTSDLGDFSSSVSMFPFMVLSEISQQLFDRFL